MWTVPASFTSAAILTAAELNAEVRDHATWLKAALDLLTAATAADSGDATYVSITRATADATALQSFVTGDSTARFVLTAAGALGWAPGDGSAVLGPTIEGIVNNCPIIQMLDGEFSLGPVIFPDDGLMGPSATGGFWVADGLVCDGSLQFAANPGASGPSFQQTAAGVLAMIGRLAHYAPNSTDVVDSSGAEGDTVSRWNRDAAGKMLWGSGGGAGDTNLYRSAADTLKSDDGIWGAGGLITKTKAGVPADGDLVAGMQQSGAMILDTTHGRIYFRVGSTWKYAALT